MSMSFLQKHRDSQKHQRWRHQGLWVYLSGRSYPYSLIIERFCFMFIFCMSWLQAILKARPRAFEPKIECNCRRSQCRKGYCKCFSAGFKCGDHCSCVDFENMTVVATASLWRGKTHASGCFWLEYLLLIQLPEVMFLYHESIYSGNDTVYIFVCSGKDIYIHVSVYRVLEKKF